MLSVGDSYSNVNKLYIGTQPTVNTTPNGLLTVNGTVSFKDGASVTGGMTLTGSISSSTVIGPSLQLTSNGHDLTFNSNDCFSYFYDNGGTNINRVFTQLIGAPEGLDFSAIGACNISSISIRPTYIATSP